MKKKIDWIVISKLNSETELSTEPNYLLAKYKKKSNFIIKPQKPHFSHAQLRLNHHHHKRCLLDLHHRQLNFKSYTLPLPRLVLTTISSSSSWFI
ncbi:hypothetical protein BpHYR1_024087 [Brachionus plicatilis]|uniref:Uncharacterized protein n=1 Tax=Brachionus plicatilis TaxID=10195 RepID=A0A3M7RFX8_BRAPC|nr:hypothetical protein BpHYR1_024087 [Brachionus plicatilis]